MEKNRKIRAEIIKIGEKIVNDKGYKDYLDLVYDPSEGIFPRGLIYEDRNYTPGAVGSIIVGINPGPSRKDEKKFYKEEFVKNGYLRYSKMVDYWNKELYDINYFERLRNFSRELGVKGPILWTNLVKCESKETGNLRVQTIRDDIHKYLLKEISIIPKDWVLIGGGVKPFEILSYFFPKRLVIGAPHPSSRGNYWSKHTTDKKIYELENIIESGEQIAVHIKDIN